MTEKMTNCWTGLTDRRDGNNNNNCQTLQVASALQLVKVAQGMNNSSNKTTTTTITTDNNTCHKWFGPGLRLRLRLKLRLVLGLV